MRFTYIKTPLNRYTFKSKPIKNWVESKCYGRVLNLFAGRTKLRVKEIRNDVDMGMIADYHMDALDFVNSWSGDKFDVVILDPPYSYRKSMEMYNNHKASRFNQLKDAIPNILNDNGIVITFGYHSVSMGEKRGFIQDEICLMYHGGAIHDTIACVEQKVNKNIDVLN